eukprot:TRINITY_DN17171_c0_g2_i1.p1 TRINITY_DN17171_c0_g2~~TRINITY_DN17171_c0_g2_i1.p1  ORF type:complete len:417 (-),score=9.24 TRINITY_DN17171_c0_g2_i1:421-1605(-)
MGAQWIQTAGGNPITKLARQFNATIRRQNGRELQFDAQGRRYGPVEWNVAERRYQSMLRRGLRWANWQDKDVSIAAALQSGLKQSEYMDPYVQSRLAVDFEFEYGTRMESLSAWWHDSQGFNPPTLVVANGYDAIPKRLMAAAQAAGATLVLNFAVSAVTRAASGEFTVAGADTSSSAANSYAADAVVVTVPLGVLKAGDIAFSPALSADKQGAISRLGFGVVNKVFFFFNGTFWPQHVDEYFIEDGDLPANRGRWVDWLNLQRVWGQTALEGVAVGEYALRMKSMTDAQVLADAEGKMNRMFPKRVDAQGRPVKLLASWVQRWEVDPYARGSYSYAKLGVHGSGSHTTDYNAVGKPEGRLLFAGEHTDWLYQGTVHGAYLTGIRAGKKVLKLL